MEKKEKKNGKESNITPQSLLSRRRRASVLIIINTVTVSCYTHIGEIKIKSRSSNMDGFIRWLSCEFHRTRLINSHILFSFPLFPFRRHTRARTDKRTNETRGRCSFALAETIFLRNSFFVWKHFAGSASLFFESTRNLRNDETFLKQKRQSIEITRVSFFSIGHRSLYLSAKRTSWLNFKRNVASKAKLFPFDSANSLDLWSVRYVDAVNCRRTVVPLLI